MEVVGLSMKLKEARKPKSRLKLIEEIKDSEESSIEDSKQSKVRSSEEKLKSGNLGVL